MRTNIVEIHFLAKKCSGLLPNTMRGLSRFDLMYRESNLKELDGLINVILVCRARPDLDEASLKGVMENMPIINKVLNVFQRKVLLDDSAVFFRFYAHDEITHDVLHFAETRLSQFYGPVANLLLNSAAKKSNNVGSLFANLAKNLNEKQKKKFLENIQSLDEA